MAMIKATEHEWVGHPDGGSGGDERKLIDRRAEVEVCDLEVHDAEANYSYHDYALVRLDGLWYLLETSGCSCPSPSETWTITFGPDTLKNIRLAVKEDAKNSGFGLTTSQADDFTKMFARAKRSDLKKGSDA